MKKIRAGIIGGAGYTGGELLRLLLLHPSVELAFVQSNSQAGLPVWQVHTDLLGETDLLFINDYGTQVDVLFLCSGHNAARKFLTESHVPDEVVVIDLSQDFRHKENNTIGARNFVYGLPELNREEIKGAKSIANPGCFATAIQLALLPLAHARLLADDIHINAITGSTGAGQALSNTTHFSWRDSNASVYKPFTHQHVKEITESLQTLQKEALPKLFFIPQRGNFTRGIMATAYVKCDASFEQLKELYSSYYARHNFVSISNAPVDIKQVVNTNRCFLHIEKHDKQVLITAVIDNLLKGASGQAVQNMNLIFGLPEKEGLQLKPSAF